MRLSWGLWRGLVLTAACLVGSCAGSPPPPPIPTPPPFYVAGGVGSEHGNFVSRPDGETTGPGGVRCVTYVWDRPLTAQTALRLRSASCEAPDHPGLYVAHELERLVIPLASSTLGTGETE